MNNLSAVGGLWPKLRRRYSTGDISDSKGIRNWGKPGGATFGNLSSHNGSHPCSGIVFSCVGGIETISDKPSFDDDLSVIFSDFGIACASGLESSLVHPSLSLGDIVSAGEDSRYSIGNHPSPEPERKLPPRPESSPYPPPAKFLK